MREAEATAMLGPAMLGPAMLGPTPGSPGRIEYRHEPGGRSIAPRPLPEP